MALDKITSQSLEAGAVNITALPDGVISAAKLHTTAISDKLGYTPVSPTDLAVKVDTTTVNNALALKVGIDSSSGAATIPSGTTAQRPTSPTIGMVRHNTTLGYFEVYNGNVWIQAQQAPYVIEYLVVAGGASSGGGQTGLGGGGGGGAGGYIASSTTFTVGSNHTVTIGAGGAAIAQNTLSYGNAGGNSTLGSLATAIGGGGGGYGSGGAGGQAGGSGGGGGYNGYNNANNGGAGTSGQGYAGGGVSSVSASGGGGGGAGGVGSTNTGSGGGSGGVGGAGVTWLNGSTYSRGGYGGSNSMPTSEAANSGNGGNGVYNGSASQGAGGSGIVVLRYAGGQRGTGGSITSSGGYTYHTFTSSGTFTA